MKAKEVHAILNPALAGCYRTLGFEPVNRGRKVWYRGGKDRFLFLSITLDAHYGYVAGSGGSIYLRGWISEFLHPQCDDPFGVLAPRQLLPESFLHRMRDLNDAVAIKTGTDPVQSQLDFLHEMARHSEPTFRANAEEAIRDFENYRLRQDAMNYLNVDDVKRWADFLTEAVPCAATELARRDELGLPSRP